MDSAFCVLRSIENLMKFTELYNPTDFSLSNLRKKQTGIQTNHSRSTQDVVTSNTIEIIRCMTSYSKIGHLATL